MTEEEFMNLVRTIDNNISLFWCLDTTNADGKPKYKLVAECRNAGGKHLVKCWEIPSHEEIFSTRVKIITATKKED